VRFLTMATKVVVETENGVPAEIMYGDHSGAFANTKVPSNNSPSITRNPSTAASPSCPILSNSRKFTSKLCAPNAAYPGRIIGSANAAFDTLFKHCKYDPKGSFAYRLGTRPPPSRPGRGGTLCRHPPKNQAPGSASPAQPHYQCEERVSGGLRIICI